MGRDYVELNKPTIWNALQQPFLGDIGDGFAVIWFKHQPREFTVTIQAAALKEQNLRVSLPRWAARAARLVKNGFTWIYPMDMPVLMSKMMFSTMGC